MIRHRNVMCAAALALFATGAAGQKAAGTKWGMAGCGFGGNIIHDNEMLPQLGAWFLNGLLSNQTWAMSSGTSNCVEGRSETAAMEQEVYVQANLDHLAKDAARGDGEHLRALAAVFGCSGDVGAQALGRLSQSRYETLFAERDADVVLSRYLDEIRGDGVLSTDCTRTRTI